MTKGEAVRFALVFLVFAGIAVLVIVNPDWFSKTGPERQCDYQGGTYLADRFGHHACFAPEVVLGDE